MKTQPPKGRESAVLQTNLPLPLVNRGKVRDIYEAGPEKFLIVTTDRISAFDVVLPNPVPYKGSVLNQISAYWFDYFSKECPHHLITTDIDKMGLGAGLVGKFGRQLRGRSMLVRRAQPLTIECVIRGYVTGSGWKDYQRTGRICGHEFPAGLKQCEKLPHPIFSPSTKATVGHDQNIDFAEASRLVGAEVAANVRDLAIRLYEKGSARAAECGILIADTKFEFGLLGDRLILIDEVLTPDSSRFWPRDLYEVGHDQPSFDKQIVRNYLLGLQWDQKPPAPQLPDDVIAKTSQAYQDIFRRLTGKELA